MGRPPGAKNKLTAADLNDVNPITGYSPKEHVRAATGYKPDVRVRSVAVVNRLAHPLGSPSIVIPLKNQDLVIRVVDSTLRGGRVHEMVSKGWELVDPSDIKGKPEDFGFSVQDGRVCRGDRSRDVLMKMHRDDYHSIQLAKSRENLKAMGGRKGRDAVLDRVAQLEGPRGDEAATFVQKSLNVQDTREPEPDLEQELRPAS